MVHFLAMHLLAITYSTRAHARTHLNPTPRYTHTVTQKCKGKKKITRARATVIGEVVTKERRKERGGGGVVEIEREDEERAINMEKQEK